MLKTLTLEISYTDGIETKVKCKVISGGQYVLTYMPVNSENTISINLSKIANYCVYVE